MIRTIGKSRIIHPENANNQSHSDVIYYFLSKERGLYPVTWIDPDIQEEISFPAMQYVPERVFNNYIEAGDVVACPNCRTAIMRAKEDIGRYEEVNFMRQFDLLIVLNFELLWCDPLPYCPVCQLQTYFYPYRVHVRGKGWIPK